jgi:hypothetical protein
MWLYDSDSDNEVDNKHGVNVEGDADEKTNHTISCDLLLVMKEYILSNTKKKRSYMWMEVKRTM